MSVSQSLMKYHPRIGYTYMPDLKLRVPGGNGGYLLRTNAAGFRSDREFVSERVPGTFRALLFGDSQTAGDGIANSERYSELLEQTLPGLEIFNYALSGSGTDQQFLAYQEHAHVEHDLLVLGLHVENIRRVNRRIVKAREPNGHEAYYAKPYYQIEGRELVLHNVPVPKRPWTEQTLPAEHLQHVYSYQETNFFSRNDKAWLPVPVPLEPLRRAVRNLAMRLTRFEPLPEYNSSQNTDWLLLRRILEAWVSASPKPVLLVPIPHYAFLVASSNATRYQVRFREFAGATGCHLYDPLPDFRDFTTTERSSFWCDGSGHFSRRGHEVMARVLAPIVHSFMQGKRRHYMLEAR